MISNSDFWRRERKFSNQTLKYCRYFQDLGLPLNDLMLFPKTIFILIYSNALKDVPHKEKIIRLLENILGKLVFIIPVDVNLLEIFHAIYEKYYIDNVDLDVYLDKIFFRVKVKQKLKTEFFKKYKPVFEDIGNFFKKFYTQDFKFQFL
ncbi:MAG: hypothetical protein ACFFCS_07450 [Candidatus Hodarchaeota archaeon]